MFRLTAARSRVDRRGLTTCAKDTIEPLRILFCGSDDFSIASLRSLYKYSRTEDSNILSIDVVTKKDKPTGRGLKVLREPSIKPVAKELGLTLHQLDTFTKWQPPQFYSAFPKINLIVAVSFGLLIPPRILNSAEYGGLNVHPSLLPELRGAAPLNWTIIKGHTHTGVSIQTLHPTKFDEGLILAQTPRPGIAVPENITINELRDQLAPIGADMLVQVIRKELFLRTNSVVDKGVRSSLAPKITTATKALNWLNDDVQTVVRKNRAIPKLWSMAAQSVGTESKRARMILGGNLREEDGDLPVEIREEILNGTGQKFEEGTPFAVTRAGVIPSMTADAIYMIIKNHILVIPKLLVAGSTEQPASISAAKADLFGEAFDIDGYTVYNFRAPLSHQD